MTDAPTMILVEADRLRAFTAAAFERVGIAPSDAAIAADVLVASDLRGVESHGVPRLHNYIFRLKQNLTAKETRLSIVRETPTTVSVDAHNSLGLVAAFRAMELCIQRAQQYGSAAVTVRGSNHFGIAGYYAMMALPHDMIGIAMTNASPLVVPHGGRQSLLGTNPVAYAIPCGNEPPVVVDMATSTISYGKIEIALRTGSTLPLGWALGSDGLPTTDPAEAARSRTILPLGGFNEGLGYKGYCLSTVVEVLCHALSGAAMSMNISAVQIQKENKVSDIGHFFAAYRIDGFRDIAEFKKDMDTLVRNLHACPPQPGVDRVLVAGEKEHLYTLKRSKEGIPLHPAVIKTLRDLALDLNIQPVA